LRRNNRIQFALLHPARRVRRRSIHPAASSGRGERVWIAKRAEIAEHFRAVA
jgi:hypothetical protein